MRRPGATGSGASTLNDAVVRDPESAVLNVLSSGSVIIVDQGHTYRVDQLENIPMQAAAGHFSAIDRRSHRSLVSTSICAFGGSNRKHSRLLGSTRTTTLGTATVSCLRAPDIFGRGEASATGDHSFPLPPVQRDEEQLPHVVAAEGCRVFS